MGLILFLFEYQGLQKDLNTQVFIFAPLRGRKARLELLFSNFFEYQGLQAPIIAWTVGLVNRGKHLCCIFAQGVDKF
jgi:hypothetical protein